MMRALLPAASLVLAAALEVAAWRADWTTDTSRHTQLKALRVASGQQLSLKQSDKQPDQAIVDYQMPAKHSHRVRIYMKRARLGDQTRSAFAEVHLPAPGGDGILDFGPDPGYEHIAGPECQVHLIVAFATPGASRSHTVLLYPPQPGEADDPNAVRIIHLQSSSELVVRYSANSADGQHGPRCRGSLAMTEDTEHFSSPLGMDLEWTFVAAPDSDIRVTFAPDLWTGEGEFQFGQELESLTLEKTQPLGLAILPVGQSRIMASFKRKGEPVLTANSLKLGPNFLEIGLEGRGALPIRELLADWQWGLGFAAVDLPLLCWPLFALRKRERIFLSYSRADEARVLEIYDLLEKAGGKPWIDRRNIPGGVRWRALIDREMRRSKHVLVFLTEHSVMTGGYFWMEMEIAVGLAEQRSGEAFLIPVKLENCVLPEVLIPFNTLSLQESSGRERLLEAVGLPAGSAARA